MVVAGNVTAVATDEIVKEYQETVDHLMAKYSGREKSLSLMPIVSALELITATNNIQICRDPDDDKFLSCAVAGKCYFIVSGDNDLLTLKTYEGVQIVTVSEFMSIITEQ